MGSGSSKLTCPRDYDEDKFTKILMLYDKLDKNGDHTVDETELGGISDLHVKNQLIKLENMKQPLLNKQNQEILKIESELEIKIKILREEVELSKQQLKTNTTHQLEIIAADINGLTSLSSTERNSKFKNAITDSNEQIEFWKFFEYMKTRTNDIPNITF
jgi:hypothetical protein